MGRYEEKKRKRIEEKREKLERCYMDEEDMMMMTTMMGMMEYEIDNRETAMVRLSKRISLT